MRASNLLMMGALACVVFLTCAQCSPAQKEAAAQQAVYKIEEGSHSEALTECLMKAKADSGTLAEFCVCWNEKNAAHHVDAGIECKR